MEKLSVPPTTTRTESGGFVTPEGTIYKLRAMITFAPRKSHFDINNEASGANEFRVCAARFYASNTHIFLGFFTLFWISMFIFTLSTYIRSIETSGHALNLRFATMFSRDAITLAISDGGLCVPFAKGHQQGWIRYYWHTIQSLALFMAISWTLNRQWPWVQSGFFTLQTLVMIMKTHSYMTFNGHLHMSPRHLKHYCKISARRTESAGGWDQAIRDAQAHRAELDARTTQDSTPGIGTPMIPEGASTSYVDIPTAAALRQRLAAVSEESKEAKTTLPDKTDEPVSSTNPHILVDHPNEGISAMAKDYSELEGELTSHGPYPVTYPNNLIPTLVYELEYPRTDRIRPVYLFEKTVATFGTFALLYTVTESFILPLTPTAGDSFFRALLDLSLTIYDRCICNGFAEISYFADRQFYEDWWNSTSWDEFSRNGTSLCTPSSYITSTHRPSRATSFRAVAAMFVTFLLSACVHELVMLVVTKKFRMYLFLLQLIQIPLIMVSRLPFIKRNKLMGNIVFWLGLYCGFPLLCVASFNHFESPVISAPLIHHDAALEARCRIPT
ncbi:hypothetical protein B0H14DRAFT_3081630 [Mycena olivaceomarginata]|nr:hypothetical protein B0H14DRAFT_3081630 [Mycena olivaceomarginata]